MTPPRRSTRASRQLLFEIGTEELPYQFIRPALLTLTEVAERLFKEHRLSHGAVRALGTPRRLALVVDALAARQEPMVMEVMGPSKAVAYDREGQPTRAATGFAATHGVPLSALIVRQVPKGEYVFAVKRESGQPTAAVLADLLPALVGALSFPKTMRWNDTAIRFARPIRWLLAVYGGRTVRVSIGGLQASDRTWGHRAIGVTPRRDRGLRVKDFASYVETLAAHGVIADPETRRAMIVEQVAALAQTAEGDVHRDEDLLEQAVYTVEYPTAVLGGFNPTYLGLPKEVLMTSMKEHQGYFSLVRHDGALLPAFICVTNLHPSDMALIREGNERVLAARLADAKFFFDEDRKTRLADRVSKLDGVVFHQKLGTLHQKTARLVELAGTLADALGHPHLIPVCRRAAELSKADLLTGLVGEFPMLQGVMGGEYARHDGEPDDVSQAIRDHYLPRAMEGDLPATMTGRILALADHVDTVVAFFHVGVIPTGSEDPLGLRRHALAIVRVIVEGRLRLNMADMITVAIRLVESQGFPASGHAGPLEFIADRFRYYARTLHEAREDVIDAVLKPALKGPTCDFTDLLARIAALQDMTRRTEFDPLIVGYKRAHRLIEKEQWSGKDIDPGLFTDPSEMQLHRVVQAARDAVPAAVQEGRYVEALNRLVAMKPAIDAFFDGVMVNTEDERRRANRLSLLSAVDGLFLACADFAQIAVQGA